MNEDSKLDSIKENLNLFLNWLGTGFEFGEGKSESILKFYRDQPLCVLCRRWCRFGEGLVK